MFTCMYVHTHAHTHTGTHLVVDETVLTPGQLNEQGVKNLTALGNLIQWQKLHYDFQYHTSEFECNVVSVWS